MRERATAALAAIAVIAMAGALLMLWQAGQADSAYRVWEIGQTLGGAFPEEPPVRGVVWQIGAAVSGVVSVLAALGAWVTSSD